MRTEALQTPTVWRLAAVGFQLKFAKLRLIVEQKYDPNHPRVPAGDPDGGQWTDAGAASFGGDGRFVVAQASGRSSSRGRGGFGPLTPSQEMRLDVSQARANAAIAKVRSIDPNWSPKPSVSATTEGLISRNVAIEREALERYHTLRLEEVLFGPYSAGRVPGPGPFKRPSAAQQRDVDRLGDQFGCHTCGARSSGLGYGRWVFDHQRPSALGGADAGRWGGPHCVTCSRSSGGKIKALRDIWRYLYEKKRAAWAAIFNILHLGYKARRRHRSERAPHRMV